MQALQDMQHLQRWTDNLQCHLLLNSGFDEPSGLIDDLRGHKLRFVAVGLGHRADTSAHLGKGKLSEHDTEQFHNRLEAEPEHFGQTSSISW